MKKNDQLAHILYRDRLLDTEEYLEILKLALGKSSVDKARRQYETEAYIFVNDTKASIPTIGKIYTDREAAFKYLRDKNVKHQANINGRTPALLPVTILYDTVKGTLLT